MRFAPAHNRDTVPLSFLFPAETDVLDPVFSQSTDVVVVTFVVVLKFPNADRWPCVSLSNKAQFSMYLEVREF